MISAWPTGGSPQWKPCASSWKRTSRRGRDLGHHAAARAFLLPPRLLALRPSPSAGPWRSGTASRARPGGPAPASWSSISSKIARRSATCSPASAGTTRWARASLPPGRSGQRHHLHPRRAAGGDARHGVLEHQADLGGREAGRARRDPRSMAVGRAPDAACRAHVVGAAMRRERVAQAARAPGCARSPPCSAPEAMASGISARQGAHQLRGAGKKGTSAQQRVEEQRLPAAMARTRSGVDGWPCRSRAMRMDRRSS